MDRSRGLPDPVTCRRAHQVQEGRVGKRAVCSDKAVGAELPRPRPTVTDVTLATGTKPATGRALARILWWGCGDPPWRGRIRGLPGADVRAFVRPGGRIVSLCAVESGFPASDAHDPHSPGKQCPFCPVMPALPARCSPWPSWRGSDVTKFAQEPLADPDYPAINAVNRPNAEEIPAHSKVSYRIRLSFRANCRTGGARGML
jgi:hypothetical protein